MVFFPTIPPGAGKLCVLAYILDPAWRDQNPTAGERNDTLNLTSQQPSLTFHLVAKPNHGGHIVGPGTYRLRLMLACDNAAAVKCEVKLGLPSAWYASAAQQRCDGVSVEVLSPKAA